MYTNRFQAEEDLWTKSALAKRDGLDELFERAERSFQDKERQRRKRERAGFVSRLLGGF